MGGLQKGATVEAITRKSSTTKAIANISPAKACTGTASR